MKTYHKSLLEPAPAVMQTEPEDRVWNRASCHALIEQLGALRRSMLVREQEMRPLLDGVLPEQADSARNLIHYLSLRSLDLRLVQGQLAYLGLAPLGCADSHVLMTLDRVLAALHRLAHLHWQDEPPQELVGRVSSRALKCQNTQHLLGDAPAQRMLHTMVTLPSQAATQISVVRELVTAGMAVARIDCARDGPEAWRAMAANVRKVAKKAGREVKVLMDLAGSKICTGEIGPGPAVLKLKPCKDDYGHVYRPARLGLQAMGKRSALDGVDASIGVWEEWLNRLKVGASIELTDARGAKRHLLVTHCGSEGAVAECLRTCYLTPETVLNLMHPKGKKKHSSLVCHIENQAGAFHVKVGDRIRLVREGQEHASDSEEPQADTLAALPQVPCSVPEVIGQLTLGERIWFGQGLVGGLIRESASSFAEVEITHACQGGERLLAGMNIHLPDSQLDLPALTEKDLIDLETVAQDADLVGLPFANRPQDVATLQAHLRRLKRSDMGVILRIETLQGVENLPELMLAAMASQRSAIMVVRGDLAVACATGCMAQVQDEILTCADAAHMPVIWASHVFDTMVTTGTFSPGEVSEAGLGLRAQCVVLNAGPFVHETIRMIDGLLQRVAGQPHKNWPLLRMLRA